MNNRQSGQGLIELILLIALVVIFILTVRAMGCLLGHILDAMKMCHQ